MAKSAQVLWTYFFYIANVLFCRFTVTTIRAQSKDTETEMDASVSKKNLRTAKAKLRPVYTISRYTIDKLVFKIHLEKYCTNSYRLQFCFLN